MENLLNFPPTEAVVHQGKLGFILIFASMAKFFVMVPVPGSLPILCISVHTLQVCIIQKPRGGVSWDCPDPKPSIVLGK